MEHNHTYRFIFIFVVSLFYPIKSALSSQGPELTNNQPPGSWLNHGGDLYNRRYAEYETRISPSTASRLRLKWRFYTGEEGDVSATPAIYNGIVYFPSWNGYIYAVKAVDGSLVWKKNLQKLTGLNATVSLINASYVISRTTPTVAEDKLIIPINGPAYVIAVKRATGQLVWMRQLDRNPAAVVTMSGTYYKRAYYVGVSSLEELGNGENCCTFRGSFCKLDIQTGAISWQTYMIPDNNGERGGYAGAAVWGSSPSIDVRRNHVYIATGNLYSAPEDVEECQEQQNNQTDPTQSEQCIGPDIHYDSILALDLTWGQIKWNKQLGGYDVWIFECLINPSSPLCPTGPNPDADFGEAPMMLTVNVNRTKLDIVVVVQKSGFAWALKRDNGNILWSTEAGPGGALGGGTWGAATDTRRVYTNIANSERKNFTLLPSNKVTTGGGWVAMDPRTGRIFWSTAVPFNATTNPVTIANGVLFAGSTYRTGPVYAINAETGRIMWSYETGASVYGGFAVGGGCGYVGQGYRAMGYPAGNYLYAFCVN